ncbi:hypothetical protein TCON_2036 [Astathelohania contejeani]|uniref:Uncharacterized protein n=1 Tax=Astathelohania contejeani TaxID=164912 RepID=A0ABQ7HX55_9MICR|nr:hypothetical protein TCON_2036 [Thelohania contejeani]
MEINNRTIYDIKNQRNIQQNLQGIGLKKQIRQYYLQESISNVMNTNSRNKYELEIGKQPFDSTNKSCNSSKYYNVQPYRDFYRSAQYFKTRNNVNYYEAQVYSQVYKPQFCEYHEHRRKNNSYDNYFDSDKYLVMDAALGLLKLSRDSFD